MFAYKVHYDEIKGEFVYDKFKTEPYANNDCVFWLDRLSSAKKAADNMNSKLRDGRVRAYKCRNCDRYFILSARDIAWYRDSGIDIPKRCVRCRKRKHYKKYK